MPRVILLLGVLLLLVLGLTSAVAPWSRPTQSPADFSVVNALAHVKVIAAEPHPVGSIANAQARQYLVDALTHYGLRVEVQSGAVFGRVVHNVVGVLPGTRSKADGGPAVLLVAHYDSVPQGPGASDDGAAVAALLETLRALRTGPPVKQDVIALITDGEEAGLLGARLFCNDVTPALKADLGPPQRDPAIHAYPGLDRVALVLNFDARGTTGPSIMFETSPGNLDLIRHYAAADYAPIGNSLSYDVYKMLRNDTDFTIFRRAGKRGLNFAFIGNYFYYHTDRDTVANLNDNTLFHVGDHALSLVRHFGNLDAAELWALAAPSSRDAVYFNATSRLLIHYPATWIWTLATLQLVVTIAAVTLAFKRKLVTGRDLAGAFGRLFFALLTIPAFIFGLTQILGPPQTPGAFALETLAVIAVGVLATTALAIEFRRRNTPAAVAAAGVILSALLAIPANRYLPGGSFVFLWLPLFVALGLLLAPFLPAVPSFRAAACVTAMAPVLIIGAPLAVTLFTALTLNLAWGCSLFVVLFTWLAIGAFAPLTPLTPATVPPTQSQHPQRQASDSNAQADR